MDIPQKNINQVIHVLYRIKSLCTFYKLLIFFQKKVNSIQHLKIAIEKREFLDISNILQVDIIFYHNIYFRQ